MKIEGYKPVETLGYVLSLVGIVAMGTDYVFYPESEGALTPSGLITATAGVFLALLGRVTKN